MHDGDVPGEPLPSVPPPIQPTSEMPMLDKPGFWQKHWPCYSRNKIVGWVKCEDPEAWCHIMVDGYVVGRKRKDGT
jgi:hypothetical protein